MLSIFMVVKILHFTGLKSCKRCIELSTLFVNVNSGENCISIINKCELFIYKNKFLKHQISENRICTVNFHGLTCMNVAVAFACFEISHAKL